LKSVLALAVLILFAAHGAARATSCASSFVNLDLGTYTGLQSTSGTSSATINCPNGFKYAIGLSAGTGSGATTTIRKMTGPGSATLSYKLFQDSAHGTNWGNINGTDARSGTGNGANQTVSVFPLIPAAQYVAPGTYTDTIIGTIFNTSPLGSGPITVRATVAVSCTISANILAFGTYTGAQKDASAIVAVICTNTTPYYVNLGNGLLPDGSFYPRMKGPGADLLSYRLYQNAGRTTEWRNTYHLDGQAGTGNGVSQPLTVYGRIFAGQLVRPGAYADTVIATITY